MTFVLNAMDLLNINVLYVSLENLNKLKMILVQLSVKLVIGRILIIINVYNVIPVV